MTINASALHKLAAAAGIDAAFRDTLGNTHTVSDATLRALIQANGLEAGSDGAVERSLAALRSDPFRDIPVATAGTVNLRFAGPVTWSVLLEDGSVREGCAEGPLRIAGLPVGLHELTVVASNTAWTTPLPSPPSAAPTARQLTGEARHWGIAAPVYGLPGPFGLGTYAELAHLAAGLGELGAAYVLINPVHALFPGAPSVCSPYSPSHRRFFNIAHVDPASVPEFSTCPEALRLYNEAGARLETGALIDYPAAADAQRPVLDALFERFEELVPTHPRRQTFETWRQERGDPLARYAAYQALAERHGPFWPRWPTYLRDSSRISREQMPDQAVRKHAYFQWLAESQLAGAQGAARAGGMALGLMLDLAVGVCAEGAETWAQPGIFAHGVSIGAPPDAFNPLGQNWALAPLNPLAMRQGGLRAFAETLRASMRHAGALRIDHILGLRRNFWIAEETGEGTYIRFPQAALFAVLAIEAARNRCLVIGEDLGNVPHGFQDEMGMRGFYGCRLLYFQRTASGNFADPVEYEPATIASIGSHDLATLSEWWDGTDLDEMQELGVLTGDTLTSARAQRETERTDLCSMLGLDTDPGPKALLAAVHKRLAESGSDLVTLQLEMLLPPGARLNLPGTTTQYPNWRRTLPSVPEILRDRTLHETIASFNWPKPT